MNKKNKESIINSLLYNEEREERQLERYIDNALSNIERIILSFARSERTTTEDVEEIRWLLSTTLDNKDVRTLISLLRSEMVDPNRDIEDYDTGILFQELEDYLDAFEYYNAELDSFHYYTDEQIQYNCPVCGSPDTFSAGSGGRCCGFCGAWIAPGDSENRPKVLLVLKDLRDVSKHYRQDFVEVKDDFEDMLDKSEHTYLIEPKNEYQHDLKNILELFIYS